MWFFFALSASVLWGLAYVINEQIYKKASVITTLGVTALVFSIVMLLIAYRTKQLSSDLAAIGSSRRLLILVVAETLITIAAEICTGLSIANKNAVLSSLIGISYPIFIVLFAYILFKEDQLNIGVILGGALVFAGLYVLYAYNK